MILLYILSFQQHVSFDLESFLIFQERKDDHGDHPISPEEDDYSRIVVASKSESEPEPEQGSAEKQQKRREAAAEEEEEEEDDDDDDDEEYEAEEGAS